MAGLKLEHVQLRTPKQICEDIAAKFGAAVINVGCVLEKHKVNNDYHYHIIIIFNKQQKKALKFWKKLLYGPLEEYYLHFHARRITRYQAALVLYLLKDPILFPPYALVHSVDQGKHLEFSLHDWAQSLSVMPNNSGITAAAFQMLLEGSSVMDVIKAYPSLAFRVPAMEHTVALIRRAAGNTWQASLPIPMNAFTFLNLSDAKVQSRLVTFLNDVRNACINGTDIADDGIAWLISKTGYHKSSFILYLMQTLKWPIAYLNPEGNFPGQGLALFKEDARPFIVVETMKPVAHQLPYKDLEVILNRAPGVSLNVKNGSYVFPPKRPALLFLANHTPGAWYRHPSDTKGELGMDQLDPPHRAAFRRRHEKTTYILKTPLNFFPDPNIGGVSAVRDDADYDAEEKEYLLLED